eukprot:COSAG05_NODE_1328_length_5166_cov_4.355634_3_plen_126_part_00
MILTLRLRNSTFAFSFLVQPAASGGGDKPKRKLVRVPIPTAALRSEVVGMMSAPAPGSKPYWVFGLPIWRHYQTTHLLQNDGTPQLELELKTTRSDASKSSKQETKKKKKKKKKKKQSSSQKSEL